MEQKKEISHVEEGCLQCLHYFGIFKYPLTADEIHVFNAVKSSKEEIGLALQHLERSGRIFKHHAFFMNKDEPGWAEERKAGNLRAKLWLKKAALPVKLISSCPFVRSIAISGSLSKNYATDDPDIDYFIITEVNRLWIARTLLHLFKKLTFITGHQHHYCMNFFIDTEALSLDQINQYAAIELVTLLPVFNSTLIEELLVKNAWLHDFLPNHSAVLKRDYLLPERKQFLKRFLEKFLNLLAPEKINRKLMKITDRKWRKKWQHAKYTAEEYHQALQTEIHISRNHPDNYEKVVLDGLKDYQPEMTTQ